MDWTDGNTTIGDIKARLKAFNADRDWEQFHTPKDLAICLSTEVAELLEVFLWKRPDDEIAMDRVKEELADVTICALNLAARLEVDLAAAVEQKIASNGERYPVELARGRADKYDALGETASDS